MHITDLNGKRIEVTNIEAAIMQAELFAEFEHEDTDFKGLDPTLKNYWTDIANKLNELKDKTDSMKPLEKLNNAERARMLYDLFPEEIPALLEFVRGMCASVTEHEDMNRESWKGNPIMTFDFWLSLAKDIESRLERYGEKLAKKGSLFADQLFDGYNGVFLAHCLNQYTVQRKHTNTKFSLAVELLFSYNE